MIDGVRTAVEASLWPFLQLSPFWSVTIISAIMGVFMLWVVGKTTPQERIERARARMAAAVYEMRLFLDSPGRIIRAQGRLLSGSFLYVAYMMPAFILLGVPMWLYYLHLDSHYGQKPLPTNHDLVVVVTLADGVASSSGSVLDSIAVAESVPAGLRITAPPVRERGGDDGAAQVYLRVRAEAPGQYVLPIQVGDHVVEKRLAIESVPTSPARVKGWWNMLFGEIYGHEALLPSDSPIDEISVPHEADPTTWLGMPWWWLYGLLVATIVALALRRPLGVTL